MKSHERGKNLMKERQRKDKVRKAVRAKWRQSKSLGIKVEKKESLQWKKTVKSILKTFSNLSCNSSCNSGV